MAHQNPPRVARLSDLPANERRLISALLDAARAAQRAQAKGLAPA